MNCSTIKFLLVLECTYFNVFPALHALELCMILNVSMTNFICTSERQKLLARAKQEVMSEQEAFGIDVINDGEMEQENYVYYFV